MASGLLLLQFVTYGVALKELLDPLCALLLVLRCIVALLADRSASIFARFLRIIADSCSLSSLPAGWFRKTVFYQVSILLGKTLVSPLNFIQCDSAG